MKTPNALKETEQLIAAIVYLTAEVKRLNELLTTLSNRTIEQRKPSQAAAPPLPTTKVSAFKCPTCKGEMVPRIRRTDGQQFLGCRKYPDCKGTRDVKGIDTTYKPTTNVPDDDVPF